MSSILVVISALILVNEVRAESACEENCCVLRIELYLKYDPNIIRSRYYPNVEDFEACSRKARQLIGTRHSFVIRKRVQGVSRTFEGSAPVESVYLKFYSDPSALPVVETFSRKSKRWSDV